MTGAVAIREYRPEDAPALLNLMRALQADLIPLFDRMLPLGQFGDWHRERLLALTAETSGRMLVAELDERLVGYACVFLEVSSEEVDEVPYCHASVAELLVLPELRGSGLGTRLLDSCEHIAREGGARWLRVDVLAANAGARRLYERRGFAEHLIQMEKRLAEE